MQIKALQDTGLYLFIYNFSRAMIVFQRDTLKNKAKEIIAIAIYELQPASLVNS